MGTPTYKLVFDRKKKATKTVPGSIELRITYDRVVRMVTTGVRVNLGQWREGGYIINRPDAFEVQRTLDEFVLQAKRVINELMYRGELDMKTVVSKIVETQKREASKNAPKKKLVIDYFRERTKIRLHGRSEDSSERYYRFLRWFEQWGVMLTFEDINQENIIRMDDELSKKKMKPYSKWNNYHRFLNSFILDANDDGLMRGNPYKKLHIKKEKSSGGLGKYLTREEFARIENLDLPTAYLRHARDLFVFQTYTCLSYTDLASFDAKLMKNVKGRMMYIGKRGKTNQEFKFLVMKPALRILDYYGGKLPIMSNVKYNSYLKVIAISAGINKPISSHWARHTGATMLLNLGMGMETVSHVLGHSSTKITREVYAKLLDETVEEEMLRIEGLI